MEAKQKTRFPYSYFPAILISITALVILLCLVRTEPGHSLSNHEGAAVAAGVAAGANGYGPLLTPTACVPRGASWTNQAPFVSNVVRADAAFFPSTGLVYLLGGTTSTSQYNQIIYTYNPATNVWVTAAPTLTDTDTDNLAVALLNGPSGPRIYAVGGYLTNGYPGGSSIVRVYDPVSGALTNADPWPQPVVPGGWSVYGNKLFIFGGRGPDGGANAGIWSFDPLAPSGSQWVHKQAVLSLARYFSAVATIGNYIYIAGGCQFSPDDIAASGSLSDSPNNESITERYDPATDTISQVAPMLLGSCDFMGYTDGVHLYAPGGGYHAPTTSELLCYRRHPGVRHGHALEPALQPRSDLPDPHRNNDAYSDFYGYSSKDSYGNRHADSRTCHRDPHDMRSDL